MSYLTTMGWIGLPPTWVAYDKQKHCLFGAFWATVSFFMLVGIAEWRDIWAGLTAIGIAFTIGGIIEIAHMYSDSRDAEWMDFVWTGLGGLICILWIGIRIINDLYI